MTLIMGRPSLRLEALARAADAQSPDPAFVGSMLPALWGAAVRYGLDPLAVVAQSAHETGWGRFGRAVTAAWRNTAGVKVRDLDAVLAALPAGSTTEHPLCHAMFASWDAGAEAQCQHLRAYCQVSVPPGVVVTDPRYELVWSANGGRSPAVHLQDLGGRWAPSPTYGAALEAVAARLLAAGA